MPSTDIPLPTAWLAPPPKLLAANHAAKIEAAPIAISAIIAFIVTIVVIILFNRKDAEIFQDDKMPKAEQGVEEAPSTIAPISQTMSAPLPLHRAFTNETSPDSSPYCIPVSARDQPYPVINGPALRSTTSVDGRSEPINSERPKYQSNDNTLVRKRSLRSIYNRYGMDKLTWGGNEDVKAAHKPRYSWEADDLQSFASDTIYDIASKTQLGDPY